jgi:hypothetical protein
MNIFKINIFIWINNKCGNGEDIIIANVIQLVRKLFIFHKNVRSVSLLSLIGVMILMVGNIYVLCKHSLSIGVFPTTHLAFLLGKQIKR